MAWRTDSQDQKNTDKRTLQASPCRHANDSTTASTSASASMLDATISAVVAKVRLALVDLSKCKQSARVSGSMQEDTT